MLYMAGIWNEFNGKKQFVIITRDANESMNDVHNRMPAILKEDMINAWINDISLSQLPKCLNTGIKEIFYSVDNPFNRF